MIDSINSASNSILSQLADPQGKKRTVKGLVLGYVQSGKTANFSAVAAKAIDSGYKLAIVLAGMHNNLRLQTERRLVHELCEPNLGKVINLTKVDKNGDFSKRQAVRAASICGRTDGFALAVLKKNSAVLRAFNLWLSEADPELVKQCPVLIIDDESDHASVNTAKSNEDASAINRLIRELLKRFDSCSYIGYTATPFANVLIDSSQEDDLYPRDFLVSLEKPYSYFGSEELFGSEAILDKTGHEPLPLIRLIPDKVREKRVTKTDRFFDEPRALEAVFAVV
jgi:hypothetical protein